MFDALLMSVRMVVDNFHFNRDMRPHLYMKLPGMCFLNMAFQPSKISNITYYGLL